MRRNVLIEGEDGGEDSRWRCENNPGLELLLNPQRGESELHFQTDFCCPQNGETPKYKKDTGRQAVSLPGEAGSRGAAAAGPTQQSPQGVLVRVPC